MKYAALALQILTVSLLIIAASMHFVAIAHDPSRTHENGIITLATGITGLAMVGFSSVLSVVGVLGLAARTTGFFRNISIASVVVGFSSAIVVLGARIVLLS